jgi:membrane-associated progesterone receptor component
MDTPTTPAPPKRRRSRAGPLAALVLAAAGLALSLAPPSWVTASCPWLQQRADGGGDEGAGSTLAALSHALGALVPAAAWRLLYTASSRRAAASAGGGRVDPRTGLRAYTRTELLGHTGADPGRRRILLGMNGDVFDVTDLGSQFYGPGAGYSVFAGRDSTRALALGTLSPDAIDNWRTADFTADQRVALAEQHAFYLGKYPRVGVLVDEPGVDELVPARARAAAEARAAAAAAATAAAAPTPEAPAAADEAPQPAAVAAEAEAAAPPVAAPAQDDDGSLPAAATAPEPATPEPTAAVSEEEEPASEGATTQEL